MIWNKSEEEILRKWIGGPQWAKDDEPVSKVVDLVWLIDKSVRRHEKMARVMKLFSAAYGLIPSAPIKTTNGVVCRLAVKLAPIFMSVFQMKTAWYVGARGWQITKTWKLVELSKIVGILIWS